MMPPHNAMNPYRIPISQPMMQPMFPQSFYPQMPMMPSFPGCFQMGFPGMNYPPMMGMPQPMQAYLGSKVNQEKKKEEL